MKITAEIADKVSPLTGLPYCFPRVNNYFYI